EALLYDNTGTFLASLLDDGGSTSSTTTGAGSLTATTPFKPGEALTWRARYSGVYYGAATSLSSTGLPGDYLASISVNCQTGSQQTVDLGLTKSDSPDPVTVGSNLRYTITITNAGPNIALDAKLTDVLPVGTAYQSLTGSGTGGNWSCTVPAVGS